MIQCMKGSQISRLNILSTILPHKLSLYLWFATAGKETGLLFPEGMRASIENLEHSVLLTKSARSVCYKLENSKSNEYHPQR